MLSKWCKFPAGNKLSIASGIASGRGAREAGVVVVINSSSRTSSGAREPPRVDNPNERSRCQQCSSTLSGISRELYVFPAKLSTFWPPRRAQLLDRPHVQTKKRLSNSRAGQTSGGSKELRSLGDQDEPSIESASFFTWKVNLRPRPPARPGGHRVEPLDCEHHLGKTSPAENSGTSRDFQWARGWLLRGVERGREGGACCQSHRKSPRSQTYVFVLFERKILRACLSTWVSDRKSNRHYQLVGKNG